MSPGLIASDYGGCSAGWCQWQAMLKLVLCSLLCLQAVSAVHLCPWTLKSCRNNCGPERIAAVVLHERGQCPECKCHIPTCPTCNATACAFLRREGDEAVRLPISVNLADCQNCRCGCLQPHQMPPHCRVTACRRYAQGPNGCPICGRCEDRKQCDCSTFFCPADLLPMTDDASRGCSCRCAEPKPEQIRNAAEQNFRHLLRKVTHMMDAIISDKAKPQFTHDRNQESRHEPFDQPQPGLHQVPRHEVSQESREGFNQVTRLEPTQDPRREPTQDPRREPTQDTRREPTQDPRREPLQEARGRREEIHRESLLDRQHGQRQEIQHKSANKTQHEPRDSEPSQNIPRPLSRRTDEHSSHHAAVGTALNKKHNGSTPDNSAQQNAGPAQCRWLQNCDQSCSLGFRKTNDDGCQICQCKMHPDESCRCACNAEEAQFTCSCLCAHFTAGQRTVEQHTSKSSFG